MNKKQNSDKSEKVLRIGSVSSRYIRKEAKSKFINARKAAMEKIQTLQMFQKVIMSVS